MRIYIDNIELDNININNINKINKHYKYYTKIKQYIYSDEGIFIYKYNNLIKINIKDINIEKKTFDTFSLLIDNSVVNKSIINNSGNNYQIPLNYKLHIIYSRSYNINNNIKFIVCQDENNKITDLYFKIKKNIDNYSDISSLLLLLK